MKSISINQSFSLNIRKGVHVVTYILLMSWSTIALSAPIVVTGKVLDVKVDVETCSGGYTWCSQASPTGINEGMATVGNYSPVLLMIQLIDPLNVPITGLLVTDFRVSHIVSPSGSGVVKPSTVVCPACFRNEGNGAYRLLVQTNIAGNPWLAGTYFTHLEIQLTPTTSTFVIVPIKIQ